MTPEEIEALAGRLKNSGVQGLGALTPREDRRYRARMGCMTDCVGFVFGLCPERVPLFLDRKTWNRRLKAFYRRRGYRARWILATTVPKRGTHIVVGDSLVWKRAAHAVVYRNGRLVFDPDYPSKWSTKRITHRLHVTKKGKR